MAARKGVAERFPADFGISAENQFVFFVFSAVSAVGLAVDDHTLPAFQPNLYCVLEDLREVRMLSRKCGRKILLKSPVFGEKRQQMHFLDAIHLVNSHC